MLHNRWVRYGALGFVGFYLFTHPVDAGHAVQSAVGTVQTGADRAATFVTTAIK
ncbi:hypothetical protein AB0C10_36690 [Microbispora amethystogenes]|uniref:hypothetical protein n=1 Tax=Microbispora amethystogenes TaxID=1427754 RepID=UPI0033FBA0A6